MSFRRVDFEYIKPAKPKKGFVVKSEQLPDTLQNLISLFQQSKLSLSHTVSLNLSVPATVSPLMAPSDSETLGRHSLIPTFLYSCPSPQQKMEASSFVVRSPSEKRSIEMFSPAFYGACAIGGTLSCGVTHTAVTPLDVVKCNIQVSSSSLLMRPLFPATPLHFEYSIFVEQFSNEGWERIDAMGSEKYGFSSLHLLIIFLYEIFFFIRKNSLIR